MGTLGGFPNPPALWLRRAKPAFAYAIIGTLKRFPNPPATGARDACVGQGLGGKALAPEGGALAPGLAAAAAAASPWAKPAFAHAIIRFWLRLFGASGCHR